MSGTVEIPLTRGHVALIDAADYQLVTSYGKWHTHGTEPLLYARTCLPYVNGIQPKPLMHIVIFGDRYVDHRNGNGLDNRRSNLRKATIAQNNMNRPPQSRNTSGFKGVFWFPKGNKNWRAMVRHEGRLIHLGLFHTREDAAAAYDAAAIDLFGEFARPNFAESK
jgi:hypothetical protein